MDSVRNVTPYITQCFCTLAFVKNNVKQYDLSKEATIVASPKKNAGFHQHLIMLLSEKL